MSYGRIFEDETISLDVLYHLEDYHLPIIGGEEYHREVESFHGGLKYEKKKGESIVRFSSCISTNPFQTSRYTCNLFYFVEQFLLKVVFRG